MVWRVEALDRVGRVQVGSMLGQERHVGEHIGLGLVEEASKLEQLGVGDLPPTALGRSRHRPGQRRWR